jgi:flagellar protein FliL
MATSASPQAAPQQAAHKGGGKLKLILLIVVVLLLLLVIAGAAYFFLVMKNGPRTAAPGQQAQQQQAVVVDNSAPPVFFAIDPFTVNLQSDDGERYLHLGLTLKLTDGKEADVLKEHMPEIRSRILLLLSNKHPADLSTSDGKTALINEIKTQIEQPFVPGGPSNPVSDVLFTDFVVQ